MVLFALMLGLYMVPVVGRATLETPLRVVAVKASSTMKPWKGYTFDAANLIDGRVDASWQPANRAKAHASSRRDSGRRARPSEFGLGVGQWVELDLGRPYEI